MGYIMKKHNNILLIFLLLTVNLSGQISHDTIPNSEVVLGFNSWEKLFIIKDFEKQTFEYFESIDFDNLDCIGEKVYVSTIFGKNGKLKRTKIVKSASPICDSIAYKFINGLKNWLPGLSRSQFVDIPFTFPITFDKRMIKDKYANTDIFNATDEEYSKRKKYFDFIYTEKNEKIINNFDFFKNYIAQTFCDSQHVYILTDYKLKRKESINLKINIPKNESMHLLVRNPKKKWLLYEYTLTNRKIRIPKEEKLFLIIYKEGIPLLKTESFFSEKDTLINLELENYSKSKLLNEIKQYSP